MVWITATDPPLVPAVPAVLLGWLQPVATKPAVAECVRSANVPHLNPWMNRGIGMMPTGKSARI